MEDQNDFEYYIIQRDGSKLYPLVDEIPGCRLTDYYLYQNYGKKIEKIDGPARFKYSPPISIRAVIGDYFSQPSSIVSLKIKDILEPLNIAGIQLIPAEIETNKGDTIEDFYYIHIYNYIAGVDRTKSKFRVRETGGLSLKSFFLNQEVLQKIPFEKRLVFTLEENKGLNIYHKSIVDKIMAVEPKGVQFVKVEDWRF